MRRSVSTTALQILSLAGCWAWVSCAAEPEVSSLTALPARIERRPPPIFPEPRAITLPLSGDSRTLEVPGLPRGHIALNPGLARYRDRWVVVFRVDDYSDRGAWLSATRLAVMTLDDNFVPRSPLMFLPTPTMGAMAETGEDPRLVEHHGQLFVVYNTSRLGPGLPSREIHVARLAVDREVEPWAFTLHADKRLSACMTGRRPPCEKNWSPFSHDGALHFLYQSSPTLVLRLADEAFDDERGSLAIPNMVEPRSTVEIPWAFGEVRGGTQAVYDPEINRYVTFFHSRYLGQINRGASQDHYFTGFYTFMPYPPFDIDGVYPAPLITEPFLEELERNRDISTAGTIVYVQGLVILGDRYWVSYGRADRNIGIMSFDRHGLIDGLVDPRKNVWPTLPAEVEFTPSKRPLKPFRPVEP